METPTPDQLRLASPLLTERYPDTPAGDEQLAYLAESAAAYVAVMTFRLIKPVTASTLEGYAFQEVPPDLTRLAIRAIAIMSERESVTSDPKFAAQVATGRRLRGFTAGPYSESYFAPGEFARRGASGRPAMDADDQLDATLWALATLDARAYFIYTQTGVAPPAAGIQSFDWARARGGYSGRLPRRGRG